MAELVDEEWLVELLTGGGPALERAREKPGKKRAVARFGAARVGRIAFFRGMGGQRQRSVRPSMRSALCGGALRGEVARKWKWCSLAGPCRVACFCVRFLLLATMAQFSCSVTPFSRLDWPIANGV
ncbi:hypothetical protein TRIUR3_06778 [Triticum urartu]|uniref:Uncharacterized protein n=2 Tax=Triticum TaxID=4564 RepID=A0A9R0VFC0_TRITD|nr:hypothetical protein TRIUR3_06778 [Triticum urartu]VAH57651.1 unnamed protein product [Triticum turgidum subsp. durum]